MKKYLWKIINFLFFLSILYAQDFLKISGNIPIFPDFERKKIESRLSFPKKTNIFNLLQNNGFLIDTNLIYTSALGAQRYPSVAIDGTNYFVVWEDTRAGSYDIYGARVSSSGEILDSAGILISGAPGFQLFPSVAFDGTNYFVVWEDYRNGEGDIYGARVTPQGTVIDTAGIPISTAPETQGFPSIIFDGRSYFVVWHDFRSGSYYDIYGARISPSGLIYDTAGIPIATDSTYQVYPSVSFDETNYFIVWHEYNASSGYDIYGARVSKSGNLIDSTGIPISTEPYNQYFPSVAFDLYDSIGYLVVWTDYRSSTDGDIYGARITVDGVVLDTSGIPISTALNTQEIPRVTFGGSEYFVVWGDKRNGSDGDIYGARIKTSGTVIDTQGIPILIASENQSFPSLLFDGTNYFVVWEDQRGIGLNIYGTQVSETGIVLDTSGILISMSGAPQGNPCGAFDGTNYFVVWEDYRNEKDLDIYGSFVTPSGDIIDTVEIAISTFPNDQDFPDIVYDGVNYFVVWEDLRTGVNYNIYGARVTPSGKVLDTLGISISSATSHQALPSVDFDGTNYFVVWQDYRNGSDWDIYGARVTTSGNVIDIAGISISADTLSEYNPSIAFDGVNYFVVWVCAVTGGTDIYGARVTPAGEVLDTAGIPISTEIFNQFHPSVVFDGTNYFVVWEDYRNAGDADIYGARVTPAGEVPDTAGIPISTAPGDQEYPTVAFDGTNYIVVWEDYRNGIKCDIYGAKVTTEGTIIDTFIISAERGNQREPFVIKGPSNQVLFTYSGWTDYINNHPANTMRIWGELYPDVSVAEFPSSSHQFSLLLPLFGKGGVTFAFFITRRSKVVLKIYDVSGRLIGTPLARILKTGFHKIHFYPKRKGIYFYKIESNYFTKKGKILIF